MGITFEQVAKQVGVPAEGKFGVLFYQTNNHSRCKSGKDFDTERDALFYIEGALSLQDFDAGWRMRVYDHEGHFVDSDSSNLLSTEPQF